MRVLEIKRKESSPGRIAETITTRELIEVMLLGERHLPCSTSGKGSCEQTGCQLRLFCFSGR